MNRLGAMNGGSRQTGSWVERGQVPAEAPLASWGGPEACGLQWGRCGLAVYSTEPGDSQRPEWELVVLFLGHPMATHGPISTHFLLFEAHKTLDSARLVETLGKLACGLELPTVGLLSAES